MGDLDAGLDLAEEERTGVIHQKLDRAQVLHLEQLGHPHRRRQQLTPLLIFWLL